MDRLHREVFQKSAAEQKVGSWAESAPERRDSNRAEFRELRRVSQFTKLLFLYTVYRLNVNMYNINVTKYYIKTSVKVISLVRKFGLSENLPVNKSYLLIAMAFRVSNIYGKRLCTRGLKYQKFDRLFYRSKAATFEKSRLL